MPQIRKVQRNRKIFVLVKIKGKRPADVARQEHLSRGRITQILQDPKNLVNTREIGVV